MTQGERSSAASGMADAASRTPRRGALEALVLAVLSGVLGVVWFTEFLQVAMRAVASVLMPPWRGDDGGLPALMITQFSLLLVLILAVWGLSIRVMIRWDGLLTRIGAVLAMLATLVPFFFLVMWRLPSQFIAVLSGNPDGFLDRSDPAFALGPVADALVPGVGMVCALLGTVALVIGARRTRPTGPGGLMCVLAAIPFCLGALLEALLALLWSYDSGSWWMQGGRYSLTHDAASMMLGAPILILSVHGPILATVLLLSATSRVARIAGWMLVPLTAVRVLILPVLRQALEYLHRFIETPSGDRVQNFDIHAVESMIDQVQAWACAGLLLAILPLLVIAIRRTPLHAGRQQRPPTSATPATAPPEQSQPSRQSQSPSHAVPRRSPHA